MAEMELSSRPFEPDLVNTSGGKWIGHLLMFVFAYLVTRSFL